MTLDFNKFAAEGNEFLNTLAHELGYPQDRNRAARVLRAVLHTLRDILTPEENVQLLAQLPMFLKGVYVEEWKLKKEKNVRTMEQFIQRVKKYDRFGAGHDFETNEDVESAAKTLFIVLHRYISLGELEDIKAVLPKELKSLVNPVLMV
ncbi:MAG TPA: DUF2267 domain-containing protein [Chitinophagales bacterium]|nr:DUF2267 domain-containing protein [Chitinophagales bacterium]